MRDKFGVHGRIEIELKGKHYTRTYVVENQLTQFGKSYVMSTGLAGLFSCNSVNGSNKIFCTGKAYDYYSSSAPVGAYTVNVAGDNQITNQSRLTNMLLNNPTLAVDKGLYIPSSAELAAYAYNDTNVSGTLKEGINSMLKDSQQRKNRVVRRFEYNSDLACEFNTIAMSTLVPTNAAGKIKSLVRSIQPQTYSSSYVAMEYINPLTVKDGQLVFKAQNNSTYTMSIATGTIAEGGSVISDIPLKCILSIFYYGNYAYVVFKKYLSNYNYYFNAVRVYDSAGTQVDEYALDQGYSYSMVYYNGTFYAVDSQNSSNNAYPFEVGSNGWLVVSSTGITPPVTLDSSMRDYAVCGSNGNYVNVAIYFRSDSSGPYADRMRFVDSNFALVGDDRPITGCAFMYGNSIFTIGIDWQLREAGWGQKLDGLVEHGNLLSYCTLGESIQKNVGDTLYITYSYLID